jgi:hypothetical protein
MIQMFLDSGCDFGLKFLVFLPAPEGGSCLVFALGLKRVLTCCALQEENDMWSCSVLTVDPFIAV